MSQLLVIGGKTPTQQLTPLLLAYAQKHTVTLFHGDPSVIHNLEETAETFFKRGIAHPTTFGEWLLFACLLPFIFLILAYRLIRFRMQGYTALLLTSTPEKLAITPFARLLGFSVFWYEEAIYDKRFRSTLFSPFFTLYSKLATLLVRSHSIKQHLLSVFNCREESCHVIPFSLDLNHIQEQSDIYSTMVEKEYQVKNEALFIIGFVGDLTKESGVEFLLKAAQGLTDLIPHFQIIIVGDGAEKKSVLWLTKMLHLDSHVRFVGKQGHLSRWYHYFNVFVCPRTTGTEFCFEVAHAMAAGIPVVATNVPGITEVVNHQGGLLIEPQATEKLTEALFQLYNDKEDYALFAQQAKQRIQNMYAPELIADQFEAFFVKK